MLVRRAGGDELGDLEVCEYGECLPPNKNVSTLDEMKKRGTETDWGKTEEYPRIGDGNGGGTQL